MKKLKLISGLYFLLISIYANAQWKQTQFVLATFADPRISIPGSVKDSASYTLAKNAYINLLSGPQYYAGSKDFSLMDRTLALASQFGFKVLLIDSHLSVVSDAFNEAQADQIINHFNSLSPKLKSAIYGYYFGGEFKQSEAGKIRQWTAYFESKSPGLLAYSYLLPELALGSRSAYESYVDAFVTPQGAGAPAVVAYDCYPFDNGKTVSNYFDNLAVAKEKAGSRPLWIYVLTTGSVHYPDPGEYELNFQTFCPIAYGASGIFYYTWETIPERYGVKYDPAIINQFGNPTPKYTIVQRNNRYIRDVLGPIVMRDKWAGVYHSTAQTNLSERVPTKLLLKHATNCPVSDIDGGKVCVGVYSVPGKPGAYNLIFVNEEESALNNVKVSLKGDYHANIVAYPSACHYTGSSAPTPLPGAFQSNPGATIFTLPPLNPGDCVVVGIDQ